jgi:arsenate reductase
MAEGWTRHLKGDQFEPYSAGLEPKGLDPLAVKVMEEAGVDISQQHSKHVRELHGVPFSYVVTVCDSAREQCPVFPGATRLIHVGFADPPALAKDATSEQEVLAIYRRIRDEIREFVEKMPEALMAAYTRAKE